MRRVVAVLLLISAGCSTVTALVPVRSVWWAPLATWTAPDATETLLPLLFARDIDVLYVGSRGERIWVPWERYAEAVDILRHSPCAKDLRIHTLHAGPRPDAVLAKVGLESDQATWTRIAFFKLADLPLAKLQAVLHAENIECGVVSFAGAAERGHLFVPPTSVAVARRILEKGPLAEVLTFDR